MMLDNRLKRCIALLCIIIIIVYASLMFFLHSHECLDADCSICALVETSRGKLIGSALIAIGFQLTTIAFLISREYKVKPLGGDTTPVALKVKLSD